MMLRKSLTQALASLPSLQGSHFRPFSETLGEQVEESTKLKVRKHGLHLRGKKPFVAAAMIAQEKRGVRSQFYLRNDT